MYKLVTLDQLIVTVPIVDLAGELKYRYLSNYSATSN